MKKLILAAMLLALPLVAQDPVARIVLQNAATSTGNGTVWTNNAGAQWIYVIVHVTGAPTTCSVSLQTTSGGGVMSNASAFTGTGFSVNPMICTGTNSDGVIGTYCTSSSKGCHELQARINSLSGGTSPTVTATMLAFNLPMSLVQLSPNSVVAQGLGDVSSPWYFVPIPSPTHAAAASLSNAINGSSNGASLIAATSAAHLYGFAVYNGGSSTQFYLCYNSATLPPDGTATVTIPLACPAATTCSVSYREVPILFSIGIVCSNSSTRPTKTIGADDSNFQVIYK